MSRFGFGQPSPRWIATALSEANQAYSAGDFRLAARRLAAIEGVIGKMREGADWIDAALPEIQFLRARSEMNAARPRAAVPIFSRLASIRERRGEMDQAQHAWVSAAHAALEAGAPREAEAFARRALSIGRNAQVEGGIDSALSFLGRALVYQGRNEEAAESLVAANSVRPTGDPDADWDRCADYLLLAEIAIEARDTEAARRWVDELRATISRVPELNDEWAARADALEIKAMRDHAGR